MGRWRKGDPFRNSPQKFHNSIIENMNSFPFFFTDLNGYMIVGSYFKTQSSVKYKSLRVYLSVLEPGGENKGASKLFLSL